MTGITKLSGRVSAHDAMGCQIDPSWVYPLSYFSFQPELHNKGCEIVHIKEPLKLKRVAHEVAAVGFLSLSEWSFIIYIYDTI